MREIVGTMSARMSVRSPKARAAMIKAARVIWRITQAREGRIQARDGHLPQGDVLG